MGSKFGDNIKISNRTILSTKVSPSSNHCTTVNVFHDNVSVDSGQHECKNFIPAAGGINLNLDSRFILREQMACCMVYNI